MLKRETKNDNGKREELSSTIKRIYLRLNGETEVRGLKGFSFWGVLRGKQVNIVLN